MRSLPGNVHRVRSDQRTINHKTPIARRHTSGFHGARYSRLCILEASASSRMSTFSGSHFSGLSHVLWALELWLCGFGELGWGLVVQGLSVDEDGC